MNGTPVIAPGAAERSGDKQRIAVDGTSFALHEWRGSGPPYLHLHHQDDEAWHVLEGNLRFRFVDRSVDVRAGSTVFRSGGRGPHLRGIARRSLPRHPAAAASPAHRRALRRA